MDSSIRHCDLSVTVICDITCVVGLKLQDLASQSESRWGFKHYGMDCGQVGEGGPVAADTRGAIHRWGDSSRTAIVGELWMLQSQHREASTPDSNPSMMRLISCSQTRKCSNECLIQCTASFSVKRTNLPCDDSCTGFFWCLSLKPGWALERDWSRTCCTFSVVFQLFPIADGSK